MNKILPSLAVVIPCYNEEEVLTVTFNVMDSLLSQLKTKGKILDSSKIYYVDDGSKDATWNMLEKKATDSDSTSAIKLTKNKGHQNALYAGLCTTTEDIIVSIDADLQDGPENIEAMVDGYLSGSDIVFGVRSERTTDTYFKRFTAEGYYHLMRKLGVDLVFNHADFRLFSRRALNSFLEYKESNLFLRGIAIEIGYPSSTVEYERQEREAGESKYPLRKMLSFAWEGITSFSTVPLRAITVLGVCSSALTMLTLLWVLAIRMLSERAAPGWASILLPLLFIGSVQLLSLGILGEYIAKIYCEVKQRPKYHIDKFVR